MSPEVDKQVGEYINVRLAWIDDAVEVMGQPKGTDPRTVFEAPMADATKARDDDEGLVLTDDQEANLREISARFGIGAETDIYSRADIQIVEGGKPWKIEAEASVASGNTVIFAGSPFRQIGEDEQSFLSEKHDVSTLRSEFDVARFFAEQQPGFEPLENEEVLPFGYELNPDNDILNKTTGQLVKIGEINSRPVLLFRVDGLSYIKDGKTMQLHRPDSAKIMGIVSRILSASGDTSSSVGVISSTAYASRTIDTMRAGMTQDRFFDVGMYGTETLAAIKGEPAKPTAINQIPGELRVAYDKLLLLQAEVETEQSA
ncbi:MAG: hypothetical protein WDN66_02245 [Candidatus Saccharibacteria bacterium]